MPYYAAIFAGLGMRVFDSQVLSRGTCPRRLGAAIAFGFIVGANASNYFETSLWRNFDRDISHAFDERFMRSALNVSGLSTNHTSI